MTEKKRMNPVVSVIVILILIILVLAVVLGFQIRRARTLKAENTELNAAYTELEDSLETQIKEASDQAASEAADQTRAELEAEYEEKLAEAEQALQEAENSAEASEEPWVNLDDYPRLSVKPDSIYDAPQTKYIAASTGLNMRSGPGDSYDILTSANRATEVQAAAEQGEWTLIIVGDQAGWVKTSYLSDTQPSA